MNSRPPAPQRALRMLLALACYPLTAAEPVDATRLPAPAAGRIEFTRDIRPIFEQHCLRCHGQERPRSNFRLTDRASALKGGENGVAIIPGDSARSPLIHNVAGLVPDMEMPPPDKGEPLSTNQVALLRAWIDQGAEWPESAGAGVDGRETSIAPLVSWTDVSGDQAKFRELEWQPEGWNGGAEEFRFARRLADGDASLLEGHVLRDDYRVSLEYQKRDWGFARAGYRQFRKYYDDSGGYLPGFVPAVFSLDRDLHLDIGKAWVEAGVTRPGWPRLLGGYEYQFKEGDKSMLTWGPAVPASGDVLGIRHLYPSAKHVDEKTHVLRLDMSYNWRGLLLEDQARAEFYDLGTRRADALNVPAGSPRPDWVQRVNEGQNQVQVWNVFRAEKELKSWWLVSGGYLYSWLDGDASISLQPQDGAGQPAAGSAWFSNEILLNQVSHLGNLNSQFRPFKQLVAVVGAQGGWSRQESFGNVNLDEVNDPNDPTTGITRINSSLQSLLDKATAEETVSLRYGGIPLTSLFAEARLRQEQFSQYKDQQAGAHSFLLDTEADVDWQEYRTGLTVSPWRRVSFTGQYKHRVRNTDYDYLQDQFPFGAPDGPGYPGFILERDIATDEFEARLVLHPAPWLKTTLTYKRIDTDYTTVTGPGSDLIAGPDVSPGGEISAGQYRANQVSINATLTPIRRLFLSATFSFQDPEIEATDNGSPSVAPYDGSIYSVLAGIGYGLDEKSRLNLSYVYSRAGYEQHNQASGLPLGIDYRRHGLQAGIARRLTKYLSGRLQYGYFEYAEPSGGGYNDYTAHQVLGLVTLRLP